jgi:ribonuclease D
MVSDFRRAPVVAVDTEAASFHKYRDRIYLVQLSTASDTAIIDPVALTDLAPLGELLADREVEKVLHDADYDLRTLDRDYAFRVTNVFDTRIAAQLAGEQSIGLAALLEKYLGIVLSKEHQKADWSRRPLPPEMLAYAASDTRHLLALRESLRDRLNTLGRLTWAEEEFGRLEALRWTVPSDGTEAYLRIKGAKALTSRQRAALREMQRWREGLAAAQDKASFRIIGNDALLAVSRTLPRTQAELAGTAGMPQSLAARHGTALLAAVERALALDESELPQLERHARTPKDPTFDAQVERLKAARNRIATELSLDPGVLCGRGTLEAVARARPTDRAGLSHVSELRRWQVAVLGDALLAALA